MNNRKRNLYILSVMVIILIAALMTACKTEDITKRAENEEKLLKAMTEYPGNGLYDPAETVIGLDAPEPTEEELAEAEQRATEEKEAWQKDGSLWEIIEFSNFDNKIKNSRNGSFPADFVCGVYGKAFDYENSGECEFVSGYLSENNAVWMKRKQRTV